MCCARISVHQMIAFSSDRCFYDPAVLSLSKLSLARSRKKTNLIKFILRDRKIGKAPFGENPGARPEVGVHQEETKLRAHV